MLMSLVISLIWSTMFMVFRNQWGHLFNDDPSEYASSLSRVTRVDHRITARCRVSGVVHPAYCRSFPGL